MAKQVDKNPLALSPERVADKLGLAPGLIRRLIYEGKIPAVQVGRRWIVPVKALERWLENQIEDVANI